MFNTMLRKQPQPQYIKLIRSVGKTLFIVEAAIFMVSYGVWYKLNTSRDFRHYAHHNFNFILEGYYKIGETLGSSSNRQIDEAVWRSEGKLKGT